MSAAADDPALAAFGLAGGARRSDAIVVEGEIPVRRLLASGLRVRALLCTKAKRASLADVLPPELPVTLRTAAALREVVGYAFHRGVLALAERPSVRSALEAAQIESLRAAGTSLVVAAERITDGLNLGALARNAWAFGADLLLADAAGADLYARKTVRASAGIVFALPAVVCTDLAGAARGLADRLGGRVAAAVAPGDERAGVVPLDRYERPAHLVLALGNEADGLSTRLLAEADDRLTIPLARDVDSLNVAAASAVLSHALAPRRGLPR